MFSFKLSEKNRFVYSKNRLSRLPTQTSILVFHDGAISETLRIDKIERSLERKSQNRNFSSAIQVHVTPFNVEKKLHVVQVSHLVWIMVVPLYIVWWEHSLGSYKTWRDGNGVFVTGTDSPEIVTIGLAIQRTGQHSVWIVSVLPVSIDSFSMHCPVNSTASHITVAWCLGSSMISPGTSSLLGILSDTVWLLCTRTVSTDATVPQRLIWFCKRKSSGFAPSKNTGGDFRDVNWRFEPGDSYFLSAVRDWE